MLEILENIALQTNSEGDIAIGISIVVAIILGSGLFFNIKTTHTNNKIRLAQVLRDTDEDFKKILEKGPQLDSKEMVERFIVDYINMCERIARLNIKGNLPDEIADFFEHYFAFALTMNDWQIKHGFRPRWNYAADWCRTHNITPAAFKDLPNGIQEYEKLKPLEEKQFESSSTLEYFRLLGSPDVKKSKKMLADVRNDLLSKSKPIIFSDEYWDDVQKVRESYNQVCVLYIYELLNKKIFQEVYGETLVSTWKIIEEDVKHSRTVAGPNHPICKQFEEVVNELEKLGIHAEPF